MTIAFDNSYARLPDRFFTRTPPTRVAGPRLIKLNTNLATELGIDPDWLATPEGIETLAGNYLPGKAEPVAMAYAGHQFGNFVPQLGDGRAILLGETVGRDGIRRDIHLKGAGPTPFSRRGDGRAALGPVLREYILSEAMQALGIPTTRALAAVSTGEQVARESWLPGAVFTRVARSHIRVGTFQFFAAQGDTDAVKLLADYAIERLYPGAANAEPPYRAFLDAVISAQAALIARWMGVGFIHGVMNTDNMAISGETIDYGPCAFMDAYSPGMVFSSIDQQGRYAYANQPRIAQWNLARLAETLLPLLTEDVDAAVVIAEEALSAFAPQFQAALQAELSRKIGLLTVREGDPALIQELLNAMAASHADFTLTFRTLADVVADRAEEASLAALFEQAVALPNWLTRWRARLAEEPEHAGGRAEAMRLANPAYIPRNHQVEAVIVAAVERNDFAPFERLVEVLANPYQEKPGAEKFALPPEPDERVLRTFCGT